MSLNNLRQHLDQIDEQILKLLASRFDLSRHIAQEKQALEVHITQPDREAELMKDRLAIAQTHGLSPQFTEQIFALILAESKRIQHETID